MAVKFVSVKNLSKMTKGYFLIQIRNDRKTKFSIVEKKKAILKKCFSVPEWIQPLFTSNVILKSTISKNGKSTITQKVISKKSNISKKLMLGKINEKEL